MIPSDVPTCVGDTDKFHHIYWQRFLKFCPTPWLNMDPEQKKSAVRAFIFAKFTLDPKGKCMKPAEGLPHKKRNDACWPNFYLYDEELDEIVDTIMAAYVQSG